MNENREIFSERDALLKRFLDYVVIDTGSDPGVSAHPSTPGQRDLLHLLRTQLEEMHVDDIYLDENGYLIARIPPRNAASDSYIGLMAHVDTSSDCPGNSIKPRIHRDYDGTVIPLESGITLDPAIFPALHTLKGHTLISSDGTTLLGADDKAGIAEIMTVVDILRKNPDIPHCGLEIIFTSDEETGRGMDLFPLEKLRSPCCYTIDGDGSGTIEAECFNAYRVVIRFYGRVIHLGKARGRLVNAVSMAGTFIERLPRNESPEATDGRFGYYCPMSVSGNLEYAEIEVYLRDYNETENLRRIEMLTACARSLEAEFSGGRIDIEAVRQYINMKEVLDRYPHVVRLLDQAVRETGSAPVFKAIRGGTDGARLAESGIPAPNLFTGGENYHSREEYVSLDVMLHSVAAIVRLAELWAERTE